TDARLRGNLNPSGGRAPRRRAQVKWRETKLRPGSLHPEPRSCFRHLRRNGAATTLNLFWHVATLMSCTVRSWYSAARDAAPFQQSRRPTSARIIHQQKQFNRHHRQLSVCLLTPSCCRSCSSFLYRLLLLTYSCRLFSSPLFSS